MLSRLSKILLTVLLSSQALCFNTLEADEVKTNLISRMKCWFSPKDLQENEVVISQVKEGIRWKRYDYTKNCGFSSEFPGDPDHSGQIVELPQSELTIRYDTYVTETQDDNTVYVVSVWEYPEKVDISRPELNLQEGFSGMLQALPESQVLFMQAKDVQGHKALEFWISCNDIYFRGMLVSVNRTLYQVFMVYKGKDPKALDKEYERFTKSFRITKVRESKSTVDLKKKVSL